MKYFFVNWKANFNYEEMTEWSNIFFKNYQPNSNVITVICPPFPFIPVVKKKFELLNNVFIGSQTVSTFEKGSYTGEVTALTLKGLVKYSIIGHSERRKFLKENDDELFKKVVQSRMNNIEPIFCIRGQEDIIPEGVKFVAYEPVHSIGTGKNESLSNILTIKKTLHLYKSSIFLYGGSVNNSNIHEYLSSNEVHGFIFGKASLDPSHILSMINKVSE